MFKYWDFKFRYCLEFRDLNFGFILYAATKGNSAICLACFKDLVTILWCFGQVPVRL